MAVTALGMMTPPGVSTHAPPYLLKVDSVRKEFPGVVALDRLKRLGWIGPEAWISLETSRKEDVRVKGFTVETVRDVGKARLHLLRPAAIDPPPSGEDLPATPPES